MLKLTQRALVGRSSQNQRSGLIVHPTQDMVVLYAASSAASLDAFLTYIQEQFDHEEPQTSLEFHQLLDRCLSTAARMEVSLSLIAVWILSEQVILAAYNGSVWLKRGTKHGQILSSDDALQLLEGHAQSGDVYVLMTSTATNLSALMQPQLERLSSSQASEILDLPELRSAMSGVPDEGLMGVSVVTISTDQEQKAPVVDVHDAPSTVISADEPLPAAKRQSPLVGVVNVVSGMVQSVSQLFSQDVYVRQQKRRSAMKVGALVLLIIILIGVGLWYARSQQLKRQQEVQATLLPYQNRLEEIKTLSLRDTVQARQNTELLVSDLEAQTQQSNPKHIQTALSVELADLKAYYQSISGQEELSTLPIFFDLRLVQSNFLASKVDATLDTLFFLDSGQKKILALNIERKQPTILPIGEYPDIRSLSADDEFLYFLGEGLFRFTLSGTDVATLVENPDDTIKTGQYLGLFDKYLYVLNKDQNNIFRYDTDDDSVSGKPVSWVQGGQGIDFAQVQSMSIDGDVWLTTQTGEIKKLSSGQETSFAVTGLKDAFSTSLSLFTKPDMNNLYILEAQKSRVVVLNKNGQFIKEVKNNNLAGATSVVASEKNQKAFALSGSLVYEIGL